MNNSKNLIGKKVAEYTIGKYIATGGFSVVHECTREDDLKIYVVKAIDKSGVLSGDYGDYYNDL